MNTVWTSNPFPAVGIRPIIDGRRRGIRESLEAPTMEMARNAAKCANKFHAENVGVSLSVTRCWCYGTETMDADPQIPKAVWGFNGTERPGAVYLACMLAGYAQRGMPCFGIYGRDVQDATDMTIPADVQEKLLRFVRAGLAVALMKGKSYLSVGSSSMGIAGGFLNVDFFQDYLGMRPENMDMCEVERRVAEGIYDKEEYARALAWVKKNCPEGRDFNPKHLVKGRAAKDADWEYVVKMAIILRDMMVGNPVLAEMGYGEEAVGRNALCAGFQGQRQWTDHWPNGDFAEAWLNTSFDWNGPREPFTFATENDTLNGVSMLLMHLLTNRAQLFADVRTFWSPDAVKRATGWWPTGGAKNGFIHLINSGAATLDATGAMKERGKPTMKEWWNVTEKDMRAATKATEWCPAALEYFRGGGYSSSFTTEGGMPMTMIRLSLVKGLGPILQIAEGWSVALPKAVHEKLMLRTDPTWPCTWFAPRITGHGAFKDVYSVMNGWSANHGAISYGHIGKDVTALAALLRIPVAMSNVADAADCRPHCWGLFGADDPIGADYRACAAYGPLY